MKSAAIFIGKKNIYLHSYFSAKAGYSIASEPFIRLEIGTGSEQLVQAIRNVVESSKTDVPTPDFTELNRKVSSGLGLKSANELENSAVKHCFIKLKEDILSFVPTRHAEPPEKGHLHKPNEEVNVSFQSRDEEINVALQLAFSRCE